MGLFDRSKEKERYDARLTQVLGHPWATAPARPDESPGSEPVAVASPAPAPVQSPAPATPPPPAIDVIETIEPEPEAATPPPPFEAARLAPPAEPLRAQPSDEAPPAPPPSATWFFPLAPGSLEETGLTAPFVQDHLVRTLYFLQQATGGRLAEECGLPFAGCIAPQLEALRKDQFVEVRGQKGIGDAGYVYGLTGKGSIRALEALQKTQYRGPLPVPLDRYIGAIKAQTLRHVIVTEDTIRAAFHDMVLSEDLLDQVGPAVNSASALFLFGYPGNGKTSIAERITNLLGDAIYLPHAVEADGFIIKLFDPLTHAMVGPLADGQDGRWVRVRRPVVMVGGELVMSSLDLLWNESGRFHEAPLQMKANGGMFLIDDFGRQTMRPQDLLNRWIVPLEKRVDFLTLSSGKKIQIPFDELIVFSTNLDPNDLVDDAFLRRIKFKIDVKDPTMDQFVEVMRLVCSARRVPFHEGGLNYMLDKWWRPFSRPLRMCQPRDIVDQMIAIAKYKRVRPDMADADLIDRACSTYFVMAGRA